MPNKESNYRWREYVKAEKRLMDLPPNASKEDWARLNAKVEQRKAEYRQAARRANKHK